MFILVVVLFWALILYGREELGLKGILISVGIWASLLLGSMYLQGAGYYLFSAMALLDIILILMIFGGDIRIR